MAEGQTAAVQADLDEEEKPGKYPIGAVLLLFFEIFRNWASGANRSVPMMFVDIGGYSQDEGTQGYHSFISLSLIFPIVTAIIADTWTGKYPVLLGGTAIVTAGLTCLTTGALPAARSRARMFIWTGMVLRSLGWGCLQPMIPLAADQFELPRQKKYLSQFFGWQHMIANIVMLLAIFLTAIIRFDVHCLGDNSCYPLAFFIPTVLMGIFFFCLLLTKKIFKLYTPAKTNVITSVACCILTAIWNKFTKKKGPDFTPIPHWIYYAKEKYGEDFVEHVRGILGIMLMCLPTIMVWCVYMQFESRWVYQATRINMNIGPLLVKPEQIIIINNICVILFIPILTLGVYPLMKKFGISRPLLITLIGGLFINVSFLMSAFLELAIERRMPPQLDTDKGQLRLYNGEGCNYIFSNLPGGQSIDLDGFGYYEDTDIEVKGKKEYTIDYDPGNTCPADSKGGSFNIEVQEKLSKAHFFNGNENPFAYSDVVNVSDNGNPYFRILAANLKDEIVVKNNRYTIVKDTLSNNNLQIVYPGVFDMYIAGKKVKSDYEFQMGGHYVALVKHIEGTFKLKVHMIKEPNHYRLYMQLPQIICISIGELLFMLPMREFVYGESPATLTTFMWAFNELMNGLGNMITVIFASTENLKMSSQLFVYSGALLLTLLIFSLLICRYKYVNPMWGDPSK